VDAYYRVGAVIDRNSFVEVMNNSENKVSTSCSKEEGLAYLIAEFPAANHNYLLGEIAGLRVAGFTVRVVSVRPSVQPVAQQGVLLREEGERAYCIKSTSRWAAISCMIAVVLRRPRQFCSGLWYAFEIAGGRGVFYFAEAVLLGHWMEQNELSHVHAHFAASVALITAKIFPQIAASFTAHGYGEFYSQSPFTLSKKVRASTFARSISYIGRANLMLAVHPDLWPRIVCSPLGIAPDSLRPTVPTMRAVTLRISCVGRLSPEKGNLILLDAVSILVHQGLALHLRLIGDGPDLTQLQEKAADLRIADHVSFEGWISSSDIMAIYSETDVVAMASLYEGIPIALMEAMSMGIPCVAPRVGGIAELIEDGVSGFVFNPGQTEELAYNIKLLADSTELRTRMGARARERVLRHFDINLNTANFAKTLRKFWVPPA
jgi:colanic acid/amylovoran biosynthesis glycosyltransferase